MKITIGATYENGVLVPVHPLDLAEHESVTVTVEARPAADGARNPATDVQLGEKLRWWSMNPIPIAPEDAEAIASDPEFRLLGGE